MQEAFATTVYILCLAAAVLCTFLLARSYRRTGARLLFWSALCFALLAGNSAIVIVDILVLPAFDFGLLRIVLTLAASGLLVFGFIWDLEE